MRLALLLVIAVALCGCGTRFMKTQKHPLDGPPAGMALVCFHRPSSWQWDDDCPVFDGTTLIGNLRGEEWFQYACKPGHHVFIGRAQAVSVTDSTLAAGKTYDFVLDVGIGAWHANVVLQPLHQDDPRRAKVARWERGSKLLDLDDGKDAQGYAEKYRAPNERAIQDFTTGAKQDRLLRLSPGDGR